LNKEGDNVYACFGKDKILLPANKATNPALAPYLGKEVYIGIRPENIHDDPMFLSANPDAKCSAYVEVTEMMGSETYLYLTIAGTQFTARVSQNSTAQINETIEVGFEANKIHIFDKDTEITILN